MVYHPVGMQAQPTLDHLILWKPLRCWCVWEDLRRLARP